MDATLILFIEFPSFVVAKGQWIQLDFKNPVYILGVITEGRNPQINDQRITSFNIAYGNSTNQLLTIKSKYSNENKVCKNIHKT